METKYTKDGKKVAIVGQLNQTEWIVQEIYVTDSGDEIPQGEKFTCKSLLDERMETYADRKIKDLNKKINLLEQDIQDKRITIDSLSIKTQATAAIIKSNRILESLLDEKEFTRLADFMSGNINWIYEKDSCKAPDEFINGISMVDSYYNDRRYEGIKLLSVFGKSNGELEYMINRYSCGSGDEKEYLYYATREEAFRQYRSDLMEAIKSKSYAWEYAVKAIEDGEEFTDEEKENIKASFKAHQQIKYEKIAKDSEENKIKLNKETDIVLSKIN